MKFLKIKLIGIGFSIAIIIFSFFLFGTRFFFFVFGIGILTGLAPFVFSIINETRISTEKEEMFLEFSRNLVESVKTGTPVNKSIINVKDKPYGVLSENIKKLANQISLGIPLERALQTFSRDVKNKSISRALTLIGQAERSGGEIGGILESVTGAISTAEKLKKERKAAISTLVVQGYIIFLVFIVIILVLQFQILPLLIDVAPDLGGAGGIGIGGIGGAGGGGAPITQEEIASSFIYLLVVQGFFAGLAIGKLSEGSIKAGVRHSFALMLISFLIATGANVVFGG